MSNEARNRREQVVVYLDPPDDALLTRLVEETGLAKTELFRRGLRRLAAHMLEEGKPGSSLEYLIGTAADDEFPADVAERHDRYLYGGGYERRLRKRAGSG